MAADRIGQGKMDRPLRRIALLFALLFLALVVQLTYVQVWAAPKLRTHPNNTRALEQQMRVERGIIVSADGVVLAENRREGEYFFRRYPRGELGSPWLGYASLRYGLAGLERVYNPELVGEADIVTVRSYLDTLTGKPRRGADLQLTVDSRVQRAAESALGQRPGAVVALDPRTGAVLALVSAPRFDPNRLEERWQALNRDPARPLVNRALSGRYPPGSAFKVIVTAAALATGVVTPDAAFNDEGSYLAGGYRVHNFANRRYGAHDFRTGFAESINTTFAKVGVALGGDTLASYAEAFGFGEVPPWPLGGAPSLFPSPERLDTAHVAQASFGQGELLATPLQMALVASGIANSGRVMRPYVVAEVRDYQRRLLHQAEPKVWRRPASAAVAAQVRDLMVAVVESGTGTRAAIPGVRVAGKTGSAEMESGEPHAWFIGFAPADSPRVAVAVLVEHGGTGGATAAPVAARVMAAALDLE